MCFFVDLPVLQPLACATALDARRFDDIPTSSNRDSCTSSTQILADAVLCNHTTSNRTTASIVSLSALQLSSNTGRNCRTRAFTFHGTMTEVPRTLHTARFEHLRSSRHPSRMRDICLHLVLSQQADAPHDALWQVSGQMSDGTEAQAMAGHYHPVSGKVQARPASLLSTCNAAYSVQSYVRVQRRVLGVYTRIFANFCCASSFCKRAGMLWCAEVLSCRKHAYEPPRAAEQLEPRALQLVWTQEPCTSLAAADAASAGPVPGRKAVFSGELLEACQGQLARQSGSTHTRSSAGFSSLGVTKADMLSCAYEAAPAARGRPAHGCFKAPLRGVDCTAAGVLPMWVLRGTYVTNAHRSGASVASHCACCSWQSYSVSAARVRTADRVHCACSALQCTAPCSHSSARMLPGAT